MGIGWGLGEDWVRIGNWRIEPPRPGPTAHTLLTWGQDTPTSSPRVPKKPQRGVFGASWGSLGGYWGSLGGFVGVLGGFVGSSWGTFGASLAVFGTS